MSELRSGTVFLNTAHRKRVFYGGQLTLLTLSVIIYFTVSLSHRRSTQFLSKLNPLSFDIPDINVKAVIRHGQF